MGTTEVAICPGYVRRRVAVVWLGNGDRDAAGTKARPSDREARVRAPLVEARHRLTLRALMEVDAVVVRLSGEASDAAADGAEHVGFPFYSLAPIFDDRRHNHKDN
jgi:hypothetical protein